MAKIQELTIVTRISSFLAFLKECAQQDSNNWSQAKKIGDIQLASKLRMRGKNLNNEDLKENITI